VHSLLFICHYESICNLWLIEWCNFVSSLCFLCYSFSKSSQLFSGGGTSTNSSGSGISRMDKTFRWSVEFHWVYQAASWSVLPCQEPALMILCAVKPATWSILLLQVVMYFCLHLLLRFFFEVTGFSSA
jgi:hypothetical protein